MILYWIIPLNTFSYAAGGWGVMRVCATRDAREDPRHVPTQSSFTASSQKVPSP